ncbi:DUF4256 domain-containing protein [Rasiella sp. SM2506]|uniref:DUF4256 domain-containing protein n=1 Tax=Rasiella sp. SM2506 TaxID=3423914 RepID=UPI003D7ABE8F
MKLTEQQEEDLIQTLQFRFESNMKRHKTISWKDVAEKLNKSPEKISSLFMMEQTGGEPDVVEYDKKTNTFIFYDCAAESPKDRRSICYDRQGLASRKEHKPKTNAVDLATKIGVELLTEAEYRNLQELGDFDTKTSSWLATPAEIRKLGGAIFGDFRYGTVFVYHNGAQSYYAGRGFRGKLKI